MAKNSIFLGTWNDTGLFNQTGRSSWTAAPNSGLRCDSGDNGGTSYFNLNTMKLITYKYIRGNHGVAADGEEDYMWGEAGEFQDGGIGFMYGSDYRADDNSNDFKILGNFTVPDNKVWIPIITHTMPWHFRQAPPKYGAQTVYPGAVGVYTAPDKARYSEYFGPAEACAAIFVESDSAPRKFLKYF